MIHRDAHVTDIKTTVAAIKEITYNGLTVGHLRAFMEQADLAGFSDDVRVSVTAERQETSARQAVQIHAEVKNSTKNDIAAPATDVDGRDHA